MLWRARAQEAQLLREAITLKDQQIATLEQMNLSYETSLGTCQRDRDKAMRSLVRVKGWNKVLVLAAGVLTAIVIAR